MSNTSPKLPVEFENGSLSSFEQAEIKELIKQNLKIEIIPIGNCIKLILVSL